MTVKELKNAIADAMQTMKENKHTCTKAEKEIITAQNTKKADLENQLEVMQKVIERNEKRAAEKKAAEKAASLKKSSNTSKTAEKKTADKPKEEKKTISKTSKTSKKKTVDEPEKTEEQKKTWYPDKYETDLNIFSKVPEYSAEAIENKDVLIGRYFNIKAMTKNYVYSAKEHAIQRAMEQYKKDGENPFPENIDLYEFVTMNDELYIIQSLITTSFTSIRKDDLENAVKAGHVALYTVEQKPQKKTTTRKTSTAKKTTAKKTTTK